MLENPLKAVDTCFAFRLLHGVEVLFHGNMLLFLLDTEYHEMGQSRGRGGKGNEITSTASLVVTGTSAYSSQFATKP